MYDENRSKTNVKLIVGGVITVLAVIILIAAAPFTIVDPGERAVIIRLGAVDRVLDEGIHWVTPFVEDVKKLDVKTLKEEVEASSASRDLQIVTTTIALNYNLDPSDVGILWQEIGKDYRTKIIDPSVQEVIKAATAQYTAEELVTKREFVREDMKRMLTEKLRERYIMVTEVSIVTFKFSEQFDRAIEAKVTAEQSALEQKNKLEQVKYEAQQKIETAKAEAQKTRLEADALLQNAKLIEKIRAEAELEAARRWNGVLPTHLYGSAPIPLLNLTN